MPGTNNNNNNQHSDEPLDPRTLEQLNAYLDYELSEEQRAQVRDLLRRSPAADNEMATLKATSKVLSELPPVPAPRSFAVRPAMLEQPAKSPRSFNLFGWIPSPSFALSLGSLAAACLLVLVLTVQLVSGGGSQSQYAAVTASVAPSTPSGKTYSNYGSDRNTPYNAPVPAAAAQSTATTASAAAPAPAMATAPTPTAAQVTSTMAMTATSGAAYGASGAGVAPSANSPRLGYTPATTPGTPSVFTDSNQKGAPTNNPSPPAYALNATSGAVTPALPNNQANNPAANGNINASGGIPQQNTNQTNNFNILSSGTDYWLVIEIALAILAVVLGLGALIAQRRSR